MANQSDSIWNRVPGLRPYCIKQRQEHRVLLARDIAAMATAAFTTPVTEDQVYGMLCRAGAWELPELPDEIPPELLEPKSGFAVSVRKDRPKHPEGWEPHVEEDGDRAVAVSQPMKDGKPDEDSLIRGWNLDPKDWMIVGNVQCRRWQTYDGEWLHYFKTNLTRRTTTDALDMEKLAAEIRKYKPAKANAPGGDAGYVANIADLQLGKGEGGGSVAIANRTLDRIHRVNRSVELLRKSGQPLGTLYINGMGDLLESCDGQYASQAFTTDLNHREQMNVTRRLLMKALKAWAPLFQKVVVSAVGGNHGERRKDGKMFTTTADNDDVAVFDQLEDMCSENPAAFSHVKFNIPDKALALTLDVYGKILGITHGHLAHSGADALAKQLKWLEKQALGQTAIADSDIFVTAHFHHFGSREIGMRIHLQCPSMDGGSQWYQDATGQSARPGLLTFVAGKNVNEHGWDHVRVL